MLLLGGLSILLGFWVRIGAALLVIFLIPTAFIMHNFWTVTGPLTRANDQAHFLKDIALTGGALLFFVYGTGAFSIAP